MYSLNQYTNVDLFAKTKRAENTLAAHSQILTQLEQSLKTLQQQYSSKLETSIDDVKRDIDQLKLNNNDTSTQLINAINSLKEFSGEALSDSEDTPIVQRDIVSPHTPKSYVPFEGISDGEVPMIPTINIGKSIMLAPIKTAKNISTDVLPILQSSHGGLAIAATGSQNLWVVDTSKDDVMNFHVNDESITPLSIDCKGLTTPSITIGDGNTISRVTSSVSKGAIDNDSIPTTRAMTKYVEKYVKTAMGSAFSSIAEHQTYSADACGTERDNADACGANDRDNADACGAIASDRDITLPDVDIFTKTFTALGNTKTVHIEGANGLSFKDDNKDIIVKPSHDKGLTVGNFQLKNDRGILCKLVEQAGTNEDLSGRVAYATGEYEYVGNMLVPTVTLSSVNVGVGVIDMDITQRGEYVHDNSVFKLPTNGRFVTVITHGPVRVQTSEQPVVGNEIVTTIPVAGKNKQRKLISMRIIGVISNREALCLL